MTVPSTKIQTLLMPAALTQPSYRAIRQRAVVLYIHMTTFE